MDESSVKDHDFMGEEAGHHLSWHATEAILSARDSKESELPKELALAPFSASEGKSMSKDDGSGTETHPADAMDRSVDESLPFDAWQSIATENGIKDWILGHAPLENSNSCPFNMPLF